MIVRHPTLSVAYDVPDADVPRWEASGWLSEGVEAAPAQPDAQTACPVCGASGDEECRTPSGKPTERHKARD